MLDLLSDILTRLSLRGTLYFRTSFTEPWGVRVPAHRNVARFHFAHRGEAVVRVEGQTHPVVLAQGDLVIIPHGAAHVLSCRHTGPEEALPLDDVLARSGFSGHGTLVWGGEDGPQDTQLICGHFTLAEGSRHMLFDRLPPLIHLRGYGEEAGPWLEATLRVIGAEAGGARVEIGADRYMKRLGLDVSGFAPTAARLADEGKSPLYAAIDALQDLGLDDRYEVQGDVTALAHKIGVAFEQRIFDQALLEKKMFAPRYLNGRVTE